MEGFEPTDRDRRFLAKYLIRQPGDPMTVICRRAKLGAKWFQNRKSESPEFREWFFDEVSSQNLPRLLDLQDRFIRQMEGRLEEGEAQLNRDDLKLCRDLLRPMIQSIDLRVKREDQPMSRADQLRAFAEFLDEAAKFEACEVCGMPKVQINLWRLGLDEGEEVEAEAALVEAEV